MKHEKTQLEKIDESCDNYKYAYNRGHFKFIRLGNWLEKESAIFKNEADKKIYNKPNFKRGEIIKVDFGINLGLRIIKYTFCYCLKQ